LRPSPFIVTGKSMDYVCDIASKAD